MSSTPACRLLLLSPRRGHREIERQRQNSGQRAMTDVFPLVAPVHESVILEQRYDLACGRFRQPTGRQPTRRAGGRGKGRCPHRPEPTQHAIRNTHLDTQNIPIARGP